MDLSHLNPAQLAAVTAKEQYIRVTAGAGSGKTLVLTSRIAYLIENGVSARHIYAITFTNKAAREMRERVARLCATTPGLITTFHSLAVRILREDISRLGYPRHFAIIDDDDQTAILKRIAKELGVSKSFELKELKALMTRTRAEGNCARDLDSEYSNNETHEKMVSVFSAYEAFLESERQLDFDLLLVKAVELLKNYPEVATKWQNRISYLLVDEFQDTNDIQAEMINRLITRETHLFVVGDADQTIYTWRGANAEIFRAFINRYENTGSYLLTENYRSTQNILDAANRVIANNIYRDKKELFTRQGAGKSVQFLLTTSAREEAKRVASSINALCRAGIDLQQIVILFRAAWISKALEKELMKYHIPYQIIGGIRFAERIEVKHLTAYLRLVFDPHDEVSLTRIINVPRRGIGEVTLETMRTYASEHNTSLFDAFKQNIDAIRDTEARTKIQQFIEMYQTLTNSDLSPSLMLSAVLEMSGYGQYLRMLEDGEERQLNVEILRQHLIDVESEEEGKDLAEILQDFTLQSAQDEISDRKCLKCMTIHAAKGLEFDYVYLISVCDDIFPSRQASLNNTLEEERRLAYVAFTRAKKQLVVSAFEGKTLFGSFTGPSLFFEEGQPGGKRTAAKASRAFPTFSVLDQNADKSARRWQVNDRIYHKAFGAGTITEIIGNDLVNILFDDQQKRLMQGSHPAIQPEEEKA